MQVIRSISRAPQRDLEALTFIGEGYEVAQYQLHAAVFRDVSDTVVSRFVRRSEARDLVVSERLHSIGFNRLRLTKQGRRVLVESGVQEERVFAPTRATSLKDLSHALFINDLRVVLGRLSHPPDEMLAAWAIARRGANRLWTIPDVLAVWNCGRESKLVVACEVDLGGEPLRSVFLPKLRRLTDALPWAAERAIVAFTRGEKRRDLIRATATSSGVPVLAFCLPPENGPSALEALERLFLPTPRLHDEASHGIGRVGEGQVHAASDGRLDQSPDDLGPTDRLLMLQADLDGVSR